MTTYLSVTLLSLMVSPCISRAFILSVPFQNIVEKTERNQWVQGEALLPSQPLSSFFHFIFPN